MVKVLASAVSLFSTLYKTHKNSHSSDIMRQTDTICKGEPHPDKSSLVNCHGLWMPDRETFHVLFDKTDETIAEYVIRKQSSLKQRLELALKVGQGLQLLHRIQYVHLDLRPRNIRVSCSFREWKGIGSGLCWALPLH